MLHSTINRQRQNLLTRLLRRNHNWATGIRARHPRENTRVDYEYVVRTVDLGVEIYDGGAAVEAGVDADLAGPEPVVGAAGANVSISYRELGVLVRFKFGRK